MNQGGINAALEPEIELKIWKKLVVNCCLNTMCAITNQNVGQAVDRSRRSGRFWMALWTRSRRRRD